MNNHFVSIEIGQLCNVIGGSQEPTPTPTPAPPPRPSPGPSPAPSPSPPTSSNSTQWLQNTATCARIGGPILGAICGVLTPTPAY